MSTPPGSSAHEPSPTSRPGGRSAIGTAALVLTAISILGFIVLGIGSIADWQGFSEDPDDTSTLGDVVWSTFALSGLLALVTGITAWVRGRGRLPGDVRAGQIAVGWVVVAIVLSVIISALE